MRPIVEKILLEEPEDILPAVEITEPITVTDTEIAQPEVSPEIEEDAFVNLITTEISNNYTAIDSLKSIKVTLDASTLDEDKKASVNKIIEDIIDNRTLEIGMFQTALEQLNPEMSSTIEDGEELAVSGTEDIVLNKEEAEELGETLEKQPQPNEALKELMK